MGYAQGAGQGRLGVGEYILFLFGLCICISVPESITRLEYLFPSQQSDPPYVCGVSVSSGQKPFMFATCSGVGDGADDQDEERHGSFDSQAAIEYTVQGTPVAANQEWIHCK